MRRGTGIHIPAQFTPSNWLGSPAPEFFFCMKPSLVLNRSIPRERFISYEDRRTALVFTDGACLNNGQPYARAGWAFHFGPEPQRRTVSRRLESRGPFGDVAEQTSNRAELRAAIGALRGWPWREDGFSRLVIASDSEYLVQGIIHGSKGGSKTIGRLLRARRSRTGTCGKCFLETSSYGPRAAVQSSSGESHVSIIRSLMVRQRKRLSSPTWKNSTVRLWRTVVESRPIEHASHFAQRQH